MVSYIAHFLSNSYWRNTYFCFVVHIPPISFSGNTSKLSTVHKHWWYFMLEISHYFLFRFILAKVFPMNFHCFRCCSSFSFLLLPLHRYVQPGKRNITRVLWDVLHKIICNVIRSIAYVKYPYMVLGLGKRLQNLDACCIIHLFKIYIKRKINENMYYQPMITMKILNENISEITWCLRLGIW